MINPSHSTQGVASARANARATTWLAMTVCATLLSLGACSREEPGDAPAAVTPAATPESVSPVIPTSYASTRQVMLAMTVPTSSAIFAAAGDPPEEDNGWTLLEANAAVLAESGVLLTTGTRPVDTQGWIQFSKAMVQAAQLVARAAHDRNPEQLSAASDQVYAVCEACHRQYLLAKPAG